MTALTDVAILFRDELALALRRRVGLLIGLIQPFVYLLLFGPLLTRALPPGLRSGPGGLWRFFVPGLLVQLALFATGFAGFGLIPDIRSGFLHRVRVAPISRRALILGRVLKDAVILVLQTLPLLACGYLLGMRAPLPGVLASLALLLVVGLGLSSGSYALALLLPNEYLFAPVVNSLALPLMLLSGILLPVSGAPGWLAWLTRLDPLRYVVDAVRALFAGDYLDRSVGLGVAFGLVLAVVATSLGARTVERRTR